MNTHCRMPSIFCSSFVRVLSEIADKKNKEARNETEGNKAQARQSEKKKEQIQIQTHSFSSTKPRTRRETGYRYARQLQNHEKRQTNKQTTQIERRELSEKQKHRE